MVDTKKGHIHWIKNLIAKWLCIFLLFFNIFCSSAVYRNIYCLLCFVNFMLVMNVTATPLWLRHSFDGGYFLLGLWTICDHNLECEDLSFPSNEFLDLVRSFLILSFISCLIALISSWDFFTHYVKLDISESLISSLANFGGGFFMLCCLVITYLKLTIEVDAEGNRATPYWGFFIGCLVCFLCFLLKSSVAFEHHATLLLPAASATTMSLLGALSLRQYITPTSPMKRNSVKTEPMQSLRSPLLDQSKPLLKVMDHRHNSSLSSPGHKC